MVYSSFFYTAFPVSPIRPSLLLPILFARTLLSFYPNFLTTGFPFDINERTAPHPPIKSLCTFMDSRHVGRVISHQFVSFRSTYNPLYFDNQWTTCFPELLNTLLRNYYYVMARVWCLLNKFGNCFLFLFAFVLHHLFNFQVAASSVPLLSPSVGSGCTFVSVRLEHPDEYDELSGCGYLSSR